ncbi:EamA family transporter [Enterovirga sp. DB1703]|uniref:EamA family transporter n=2 Tax=Enterovirga aerilata TaxID=2730920 RepID=A0A849I4B2_9HYPH|nr:EamA family transporter [Enterovirga sp. DB1703]
MNAIEGRPGTAQLLRFLAFLAMAIVWGLTWISAKWATDAAPPVFVAGIRLVLASLFFGAWCLLARVRLATGQASRLVVASLLVNTGCYSFLFWGVAHSPTGLAAIVNLSLIPVLSMLVGALYGEETISARRIAAVALGAVGLVLLFSTRTGDAAREGTQVGLGLAAVVVATLSYAWGAIVSKPLVREMPPVAVAFWQTLIGGISLLAISLAAERVGAGALAALFSGRGLAGLGFLVLGGSLVGFSVYLWLLREWGAFRAGLYAFVSPVIAVAVGVIWAGESFGLWEGVGMAIMLAATALVVQPDKVSAS